jgi:hypothetical protein
VSGVGIALITLFGAMFSFVVSAPSIFGLKILQGLKYIIKLIKRKDEVVELGEEGKEGKENEDFQNKCVKAYTSISFSFCFVASFILTDVILFQSHFMCVLILSNLKITFYLFQMQQQDKSFLKRKYTNQHTENEQKSLFDGC